MRMIGGYLRAMGLPCLIALPFILLSRFIVYRKTRRFDWKREVLCVLFFVYLAAVLSQTVLPDSILHLDFSVNPYRLPNRENTVIYIGFPIGWIQWMLALGQLSEVVRNIGGNVLLFIPYGVLFPVLFRRYGKLTVLFGCLLSVFIESSQLFFDRVTDLNDVMLNTFGVLLGYLLYRVIRVIMKKRQAKKPAPGDNGETR